ncbi:MAG: hypothetical protein DMG32_15230 [Acidobacteria bacterium]|nr:MAG: hypothetical protein DMG32_15230 [Acidobacteriota bacterium]
MSKRVAFSMVALIAGPIAGLTFSLIVRPQTAPPKAAGDEVRQEKWNNVPPPKSAYAGKKSGPAPHRDISGIWDAAREDGGRQVSGALEHPALITQGRDADGGRPDRIGEGSEGGHANETGIVHPLPYTPLGLAALKANKPSGPGVRQVPSTLANDPADRCDPLGFPYMELYELRTLNLVQTANQVILLSPFYGNYRVIWTDGRAFPKDPEPRWNGYSVGKWVDDYTFVVETAGLNPKSWLDHAGRPHSEDLRVEERFHRVDHDTMELTVTIKDPKMYAQPWLALNKFPLHLQRPDFDIPELLCSPSEMAAYNKDIGDVVVPEQK